MLKKDVKKVLAAYELAFLAALDKLDGQSKMLQPQSMIKLKIKEIKQRNR